MPRATLLALALLCASVATLAQSCVCDAYEDNSRFESASLAPASFSATLCSPFDVDHYVIGETSASSYVSVNLTVT